MAGVLIVDDSPVIRKMLENLLVTEGYEVVGFATNGKEILEAIKRCMTS